jgi:ABC-type nitrate/sulfonate/bicarbonate transport system permease component
LIGVERAMPLLVSSFQTLINVLMSGEAFSAVQGSVFRFVPALLIGISAGIPLGLLFATSRQVYRLAVVPLEFLRAIPVSASFPLFLILFGMQENGKIAMISMPVLLTMTATVGYGMRQVDTGRRELLRSFGASWFEVAWHVVRFEAVSSVLVGLRLSVSIALVVTVVVEMFIGCREGLGQRIYDAYLMNSMDRLIAYIILVGALGLVVSAGISLIGNRLVYWK